VKGRHTIKGRGKREVEQRIINTARLLYLGWSEGRDGLDGGKKMRAQLHELGEAFALLDVPSMHRGGWGPPNPCRWCGEMRPTLKDGSLRSAPCSKNPAPPSDWATCEA
jgi:hypothetical protein